MSRRERTLQAPVTVAGTGLHEGRPVRVTLRPAPAGHGVVFARTDLPGAPEVPATLEWLGDGERRTLLRRGAAEVHTVEHLLAALLAEGVDNLRVELDGPELPALDGSARDWLAAVRAAGVQEQDRPRRTLRLRRELSVALGDSRLRALPAAGDGLELSCTLDYERHGVPLQVVEARLPGSDFAERIAPARTFVLEHEARALAAAGLGRGADTDNTVVLAPGGRAAAGTLRFPDEPARHKMLDLLGDLALLAADVAGRVEAVRGGHRAHHALARRLAEELAHTGAEPG